MAAASRPLLIIVALGAATPLAMAWLGAAQWPAALAGAAVAAAVGGVALIASARSPQPPPPPPAPLPDFPFSTMLEGLADPILLVAAGLAEDPSNHRFLFANTAARALLPIQRSEGPLTTALRAPEALEAVDEALFGSGEGASQFQIGGAQPRSWRVRATRLVSPASDARRLALLTLRDETESLANARRRADFLANASHELRTPLASLAGFIETLSGHAREDAEARARFLPIMQAQANRMRRLIENLMSLSAIEQAEHLAPADRVDLSVAVLDVLDALAPQALEKRVRFEKDLPASGAAIAVGDRDQVIQVIQNLTENALKYAPAAGAVGVTVRTGVSVQDALAVQNGAWASHSLLTPAAAPGQRFVSVRLVDEGRGIARTNLPRLTERFYRVEGQKSGDRAGTGLGLAIVKHIMNRHRGGLAVDSREGEGSAFTAFFPAATEEQSPTEIRQNG